MIPEFDLAGQRIAITGADGGIGSATARIIAEMGAQVMLSDINFPNTIADELALNHYGVLARAIDVTDRSVVESWALECSPVDALIDCAGICPFDEWTDENWDNTADHVFNVNLHGPLNLVRAFMNQMIKNKNGGRIVLIGSIAGRVGGIVAAPHYSISKGGIHSFIRWASRYGAPYNILVNAVAPGRIATPMTEDISDSNIDIPLKRTGLPKEVAGPLAFLVSPAASYITGVVLDINGGIHFS